MPFTKAKESGIILLRVYRKISERKKSKGKNEKEGNNYENNSCYRLR